MAMQGLSAAKAKSPPGLLTGGAEELFMQVFSLTDTPMRQQVRALASKADCEEQAVRDYFARLRSSVRAYMQKAQRRQPAGGAPLARGAGTAPKAASAGVGGSPAGAAASQGGEEGGPPSPLAAVQRAGAAREAGLRKLGYLLDGGGGLRDASVTAQFTQQMGAAGAPTLRCALLQALLATGRAGVRNKLVLHSGFLPTLEGWLNDGEDEQQATLVHLALQVLESLQLPPAATRASGGLAKIVARLQKDRHPQVVEAARRLTERWQGSPAGAQGPGAAAAAADRRPGEAQSAAAAVAAAAAPSGTGPAESQHTGGGPAGQRRPAAAQLPGLMALGRKPLFGKAAKKPAAAQAVGEGAAPRAAAGPTAVRRSLSADPEGGPAAASPRVGGGGGAPLPSMPSGGPARSARPMSADDIRKARAKERASAALQSLGSGGGLAGSTDSGAAPPPAKRLRPDTEALLAQAAAAPAAWRPQHMQAQQGPAPGGLGAGGSGAAGWAGGAIGVHPEVAAAVQHYELDRERRAAARRQQLVQEYAAMDAAAARLPAMQPGLPVFPAPPALQLPPLDFPPGQGEESAEAEAQRARQALALPAAYPHPGAVPPSAAEPASQPLVSDAATPQLPFVSTDPAEAAVQNERLVEDGVRLPQYVSLG